MSILKARISAVINSMDAEHRIPVLNAANNSDGTYPSFENELTAQVWDYPELPVQDILAQIAYDLV